MNTTKSHLEIDLKNITIKDGFWSKYQRLVREKVLPYQWEVLNDRIPDIEKSHAIENFKIAAGLRKGAFYGYVFQDSDVAKWLETLGYSLALYPDKDLEQKADEVINLIERAQQSDGYLDTYFIVKEPEKRWTNMREAHELYCAGHLIEAAVAYFEATGKKKVLDVACRLADLIDRTFGPGPGKLKGYCGHPEIELALVKLYFVTGEERYLRLGRYFVEERGKAPHYFQLEAAKSGASFIWQDIKDYDLSYSQSHLPVRAQAQAGGHAVRLAYLFTAAADIARLTQDDGLKRACEAVWDDITKRKMYVTGGIGSTVTGEAFTGAFDLPNDTMYTETCASVGLAMFAQRMLKMDADSRYADILELELYNGALSGISLDGMKYFYVNPLEVVPSISAGNPGLRHAKPVRQAWYACACCPPNISRLIVSLGKYIYTVQSDRIFAHLFVGSEARVNVGGEAVSISQETEYPYEGAVQFLIGTSKAVGFSLYLRIPGWCRNYRCEINGEKLPPQELEKGYLRITRTWKNGDRVKLDLDMPVTLIHSSFKVPQNAGKVAIQRGPLIYCLEETDNGPDLQDIRIPRDPGWKTKREPGLLGGTTVITGKALRTDGKPGESQKLYSSVEPGYKSVEIKAVPYSLWCNREPGEMRVWLMRGI